MISFALILAFTRQAQGMWARYQTKSVPIDRVLKNFETELAKNTNDMKPFIIWREFIRWRMRPISRCGCNLER